MAKRNCPDSPQASRRGTIWDHLDLSGRASEPTHCDDREEEGGFRALSESPCWDTDSSSQDGADDSVSNDSSCGDGEDDSVSDDISALNARVASDESGQRGGDGSSNRASEPVKASEGGGSYTSKATPPATADADHDDLHLPAKRKGAPAAASDDEIVVDHHQELSGASEPVHPPTGAPPTTGSKRKAALVECFVQREGYATDVMSMKEYTDAQFIYWYGRDDEWHFARFASLQCESLLDQISGLDSSAVCCGVEQFFSFLMFKKDLTTQSGLFKHLKSWMFAPMWFRLAYLRRTGWPLDTILTRVQGQEVFREWRAQFEEKEWTTKKNIFWAYVDRTCGSTYLAKVVVNVGNSGQQALCKNIADIADVKFHKRHLEVVEENSQRYSLYAAQVRGRVRALIYLTKRAEKLYELQSHTRKVSRHLSTHDKQLIKDHCCGKLAQNLAKANASYDEVKRYRPDLFAAAMRNKETNADGGRRRKRRKKERTDNA